jgi:hypothetical protein
MVVRVVDISIFKSIAPALSWRGHKKKKKIQHKSSRAVAHYRRHVISDHGVHDLIEGYHLVNPAIMVVFATAFSATPP